MRHGVNKKAEVVSEIPVTEGVKVIQGNNLGCYFCTDVTAPGNVIIFISFYYWFFNRNFVVVER